jgi:hypothetical protein
MEVSPEWILGCLAILAGVISTLAGIIYKLMTGRLAAQDKIIEHLQEDVARLSKGCGAAQCLWKER